MQSVQQRDRKQRPISVMCVSRLSCQLLKYSQTSTLHRITIRNCLNLRIWNAIKTKTNIYALYWRVKVFFWTATATTVLGNENRTCYLPAEVQLFPGIFFQHKWHTFFQERLGVKYPSSYCSSVRPVSLLCMRIITPICQVFHALPERQDTWHTRSS